MATEQQDETSTQLLEYIRRTFLDGDPDHELDERTPLLAWGVLDSFRTARLLAYIEDELGCRIPPAEIYADNFKDVSMIAATVRAAGASRPRPQDP